MDSALRPLRERGTVGFWWCFGVLRPLCLKSSQDESMTNSFLHCSWGYERKTTVHKCMTYFWNKSHQTFGLVPLRESLMINSLTASYPLNELLFIERFFQEIFFSPSFGQKYWKVVSSVTQERIPSTLCLAQGAGLLWWVWFSLHFSSGIPMMCFIRKCSWIWATWSSGKCPRSWQAGWNEMIFGISSNPNHSVIL